MSRRVICNGTKLDGSACATVALEDDEFCGWHHPDPNVRKSWAAGLAQKSNEAQRERREQLKASAPEPISLRSIEEITAYMEAEAAAARATDDPARGTAAARVAKTARDLLPIAKMQEENKQLRRLLAELNPGALDKS